SPDGKSLLLAGRKQLQWCDPKTGKVLHTADGWAATAPAFSPDGKLVASGRRNALCLWNLESARSVVPEILSGTSDEEIHGVAVSPDGKWIITKGDETGTMRVCDSDGKPKGSIQSNRGGGRYPLFSSDSRHLFGVASDAIALVRWEFPAGKE